MREDERLDEFSEIARTRLATDGRFSFTLAGVRGGVYHVYRPADKDHGGGYSESFPR